MQQESKKYIDEYFKDKLYDFETPAPDDVWMKIDKQMKLKKSRVLWTVAVSFAASFAIIVSIGVGYYLGSKNTLNSNNKEIAVVNKKKNNNEFQKNTNKNKIAVSGENNKSFEDKDAINGKGEKYFLTANNNLTNKIQNKVFTVDTNEAIKENKIQRHLISLNKLTPIHSPLLKSEDKTGHIIPGRKYDYDEMLAFNASNTIEPNSVKAYHASWALGCSATPLYSNWDIKNSGNQNSTEYTNSNDKTIYAYAGGFDITYETRRWHFESGIYYSHSGQNLNDASKSVVLEKLYNIAENQSSNTSLITNVEGDDFIGKYAITINNQLDSKWGIYNSPKNEYIITNNNDSRNTQYIYLETNEPQINILNQEVTSSIDQQFSYIEIPFTAHYKIIDRKSDFYISGGISANILLNRKRYLILNNDKYSIDTNEQLMKFNYSGILGFSLSIPLVTKLSFTCEPQFRYALNSIEESNLLKVHPYSFGLFSGISYRF